MDRHAQRDRYTETRDEAIGRRSDRVCVYVRERETKGYKVIESRQKAK